MRNIIKIDIAARKTDIVSYKTDLLALGYFSDSKRPDKTLSELDGKLSGAISQVIKLGDFKGKEETCTLIYSNKTLPAKRILIVGLGEKKKAGLEVLRKATALAAKKAVSIRAKDVGLAIHTAFEEQPEHSEIGRAIAEGAYFGSYSYDEFSAKDKNGRLDSLRVELIEPSESKIKKIKKGLTIGTSIGRAQCYARTLANQPGNILSPAELAKAAKTLAAGSKGLKCTILNEKQLANKKMQGILSVGSGSKNTPRLIILRYNRPGKARPNKPTVALVGKAITFDSGGINIKPSANLEHMKLDKSGGAAVIGTIKATAELKLPLNVIGIIPAAENMPSGNSYRPGDIIKTLSGKTVEVQNTDAEGRMILCDAISYAVKQDCNIIIDIATLTGACKVALGTHMAGLMSNDEKLVKELQKAAEQSGEKLWHMPSSNEYAEEIKSKVADLKNIGSKWGGACTGAAFLQQFAADKNWAHIDIAGVDMVNGPTEDSSEGASGFGVRLLTMYLIDLANKN